MTQSPRKIEFGDFQTPLELAKRCCHVAAKQFGRVDVVIEPTCGQGAFVIAAANQFGPSEVIGYEINDGYRRQARRAVKAQVDQTHTPTIKKQNFFTADWQRIREQHSGNVLFIGNPPWVTNSQLGVLGSQNLPTKSNVESLRGIEAMTGRSNFDISESILQTLLSVMRPDADHLAMLIKTATARKVLRMQWKSGAAFSHASLRRIDAKSDFGVNVEACLLMLSPTNAGSTKTQVCFQSPAIDTPPRQIAMGWYGGQLVAHPQDAKATNFLFRADATPWRSGVKHDVARIVELREIGGELFRQDGDRVPVERDQIYPLAKGADVANGRTDCPERRLLVTQHRMGESTSDLKERLPKTARYLHNNRDAFADRKSSIYRNRDRYALFGIGEYTFAPWKVAVCGLYKRLHFTILGPVNDRAVVVDDTCYTLGFETQRQAMFVCDLLASPIASKFFNARIFWDAKRPITAQTLRSLDLKALADHLKCGGEFDELIGRSTDPSLALVD